jgi:hypothetical protein
MTGVCTDATFVESCYQWSDCVVTNSAILDPIFTRTCASLHDRKRSRVAPSGAGCLQSCFLLLLIGLLVTGCASVPKDYPRTSSTAFENYQDTSVGQLFEASSAMGARPLRLVSN